MKREILFKGKIVDNSEWVEGLYNIMVVNDMRHCIQEIKRNEDGSIKQIRQHQVHPETVCQFTGLLDKNGNKIFENDKVKFKNFRGINGMKISKFDGWIEGFEGVIQWREQFGWFLNKDNENNSMILNAKGKETEPRKCNLVITNSNICAFETEIIGNIY